MVDTLELCEAFLEPRLVFVRLQHRFGRQLGIGAQQREHAVILADVLAEIAEDYREVIVLRNLEGLSFNDVAKRLRRTSGATRMLWLRAIEQLRAKLKTRELI